MGVLCTQHVHPQYSIDCSSIEHLSEGTRNAPWGWQCNAEKCRSYHTLLTNWMNNWRICWFFTHIYQRLLIRPHVYCRTRNILIHNSWNVLDNWGKIYAIKRRSQITVRIRLSEEPSRYGQLAIRMTSVRVSGVLLYSLPTPDISSLLVWALITSIFAA
jgi:hypothetical protein